MTITTIRTTCSSCQLTLDVPSARLILALPAPGDTTAEPSFVHVCPSCHAREPVAVLWRTAAYLIDPAPPRSRLLSRRRWRRATPSAARPPPAR
jgi:hypothetical protein